MLKYRNNKHTCFLSGNTRRVQRTTYSSASVESYSGSVWHHFIQWHIVDWFKLVFSEVSRDVLYDEGMCTWLDLAFLEQVGRGVVTKKTESLHRGWLAPDLRFLTFKVLKHQPRELSFELWLTSFPECSWWNCIDFLSLLLQANRHLAWLILVKASVCLKQKYLSDCPVELETSFPVVELGQLNPTVVVTFCKRQSDN